MTRVSLVKFRSYDYHWTQRMIRQQWFRQWLGAVRQQAIVLAIIDPHLCRRMVSLGHNELFNQPHTATNLKSVRFEQYDISYHSTMTLLKTCIRWSSHRKYNYQYRANWWASSNTSIWNVNDIHSNSHPPIKIKHKWRKNYVCFTSSLVIGCIYHLIM